MRVRSLRTRLAALAPARRATLLVVALAVVVQLLVLARIRLTAVGPQGGDLCQDVVAVHRMLRGQNPYVRLSACGPLAFSLHPPFSLLVVAPFAVWPVAVAGLLWDVASLGMLALALALITRELRLTLQPAYLALLLGLLIFWPPLLDTLLEAQMSLALLLLLTLAWRWSRHERPALAGSALGLAAALRLFPALAALYFLLRRDRKALVGMAASFLAASLLALPFVGIDGYKSLIGNSVPNTSAAWGRSPHNASLWGFADHLIAGSGAGRVGFVLVAAYLASLAVVTWRNRGRASRDDALTLLMYYPAMLLVSPLGWQYYFVFLLPPVIVVAHAVGWLGGPARSSLSQRALSGIRGLLLAFLTLLWLYHMPFVVSFLGENSATRATLPTFALLALAGALAILATAGHVAPDSLLPQTRALEDQVSFPVPPSVTR
ncbi:MAG TPA: glycosyltransferase family 87 protein [Ktedonobacterales bacterium]|nr:glycosyltransferase family 87 protein [Ktedonobacterales bacterium]